MRFGLDVAEVEEASRRAAQRGTTRDVRDVLARARDGGPVADEELVALLGSPHVETDELLAAAAAVRAPDGPRLETFSPLYLTNECDAECRMCGMRRGNDALVRDTADDATIAAQLGLLHRRGLRGVAILTGEYRHGARRDAMIARAAEALAEALARGFAHVLVNIGALEDAEYDVLLAGVPRGDDGTVVPRVTMCTFQETYHPAVYARFMGTTAENPRSDFVRRLTNFDRARAAGMRAANPGILLGLNPDLGYELLAVLAHVRHLQARGMDVYVSVPRLRRATGTAHPGGVSDDVLCRVAALLAFGAADAKVVVSTREPPAVQRRLLPVIGVLTPGSPGVAPYTDAGARFAVEASQFEVLDHRPIEAILGEHLAAGATIECYEPAGG